MRVELDLFDVLEMTTRAKEEFSKLPQRALRIAKDAAKEERQTHAYQNRTRNLQLTTQAVEITRSDNEVQIDYGTTAEYASYVENRGLSRITELWESEATPAFDYMVDGMAMTIVGR